MGFWVLIIFEVLFYFLFWVISNCCMSDIEKWGKESTLCHVIVLMAFNWSIIVIGIRSIFFSSTHCASVSTLPRIHNLLVGKIVFFLIIYVIGFSVM